MFESATCSPSDCSSRSRANAQNYPNKPIRWIVPYTGGGITDIVTRMVTQKMQAPLGQPIVVDNRPGANSILGSDLAAKAPPDGYTMLTVIAGTRRTSRCTRASCRSTR